MADEDMREMVDAIQESVPIARKQQEIHTEKYRKDE